LAEKGKPGANTLAYLSKKINPYKIGAWCQSNKSFCSMLTSMQNKRKRLPLQAFQTFPANPKKNFVE
jgi:hypothetical protein